MPVGAPGPFLTSHHPDKTNGSATERACPFTDSASASQSDNIHRIVYELFFLIGECVLPVRKETSEEAISRKSPRKSVDRLRGPEGL
ncbi:hypothetical protein BaRGS_00039788 [Batillaria attramentaria]|uniref:Uncharacterized protein n=1 Tax=Batillaria attramentaria TaxID=370345 RepID=A0ABD0J235_9CAEN